MCKSCCATKDVEGFDGLRLVISAVKRKENAMVKTRTSIIRHEERRGQKGAGYAQNADIR